MNLNILALGDAHFQTNNSEKVDRYLSNLAAFINQHKDNIDIIIVLGDTLHNHSKLDERPLSKAKEYIDLLRSYKQTFILVGNHDMNDERLFLTKKHWLNVFKGLPNVEVIDDITIRTINNHKIVLSPYVSSGRFIEALNTKKGEWENARAVFAHQTIRGAKMGSIIDQDADEWKDEYPWFISGHIHLSHWPKGKNKNAYYTGSIFQVSIDEDPNKHIVIVSINNDVTINEYNLNLPKERIIHCDIKDMEDFTLPNELDTKYVLYLSGTHDDFNSFIKTKQCRLLEQDPRLYRGKNGIKFKPTNSILEKRHAKLEDMKEHRFKPFKELFEELIKNEDNNTLSLYNELTSNDIGNVTKTNVIFTD